MKHTKGPWHVGCGNGEGSIFTDAETRMRLEDKGTTLYPICKIIDGWDKEEDEANAQLIASAPELLEALRKIHQFWLCPEPKRMKDWSARCDVMADYARQAIQKAEGKE